MVEGTKSASPYPHTPPDLNEPSFPYKIFKKFALKQTGKGLEMGWKQTRTTSAATNFRHIPSPTSIRMADVLFSGKHNWYTKLGLHLCKGDCLERCG